MGYLRRISGVTLSDEVYSCEIRKALNVKPLFRIERFQSWASKGFFLKFIRKMPNFKIQGSKTPSPISPPMVYATLIQPCVQNVPGNIGAASPVGYTHEKRPQRSSKEEVEWLHHRPCFVLFCYWTRRNFWDCCSPWFWLIVSYNSANKQKQYKNPPRKELSFEIRINENSYNGKRTDRCRQRVCDTGLVKEHGGLVKQPREVFRFVLRLLSPEPPQMKSGHANTEPCFDLPGRAHYYQSQWACACNVTQRSTFSCHGQ